ncbi:MAG: serine hydrolase domain-containing protein [Gammaproteobacteria bacterium]|nr:serine hydrolase domain-containing protein [Gammaproteobacteria bacterium]
MKPRLVPHSPATWLLCLVVVAALTAPGRAVALGDGSGFVTKLENEVLAPIIEETPGAAVVVVVDGKIALQKTYGVRAVGDGAPITPHTLFRIASVSKTFASAAGAMLVRQQRVDWETPVLANVGDIRFKRPEYGRRINLRHVLSQSTGLMPHAYTNLIEHNVPYERIKKRLHQVDFICEPGDCYGYQNVVFSLIGDVVEATAQVDYPTYVAENIFRPLAMHRASFGLDAFVGDGNHARPHVWNGRDWTTTRSTHHYYRVPPAAGINASIDDMKSWLLAQLGQRPDVLSPEMLDEMHRGVIETSRQQAHYRWRRELGNVYYGLGWRVFDYGETAGFVHHGGYVRGMRSEMVFNRDLQLGIVFLTNSEPGHLSDLVFDFLDLYRAHVTRPPHVVDTAPSAPARGD